MNDLMEIERFAIRVAVAVTAQPENVVKDVLRNPDAERQAAAIDPLELLAIILEIIMALIEQCPERPTYLARVKDPSLLMKIWFRRRFVRPINQKRLVSSEVLASTMTTQAAACQETELEQIYEDVVRPDFSVT